MRESVRFLKGKDFVVREYVVGFKISAVILPKKGSGNSTGEKVIKWIIDEGQSGNVELG